MGVLCHPSHQTVPIDIYPTSIGIMLDKYSIHDNITLSTDAHGKL